MKKQKRAAGLPGLLFQANYQESWRVEVLQPSFNKLRMLICCRSAAIITLSPTHVMLVDEEAMRLGRAANPTATRFRNEMLAKSGSLGELWKQRVILGNTLVIEERALNAIPYILEGETETTSYHI